MSFTIGLTGSIGMGKSTTARMFADLGVAVWDADAAVARLYAPGGAAVPLIEAEFPGICRDGSVDRDSLRKQVVNDPTVLPRLEAIVHPLVAADRAAFLQGATADIVVLDMPLLFETAQPMRFDLIVVVTAPPEVQRARVLARGTITEAEFARILVRQMPDAEKRARADVVIQTVSLEATRAAVDRLVSDIRAGHFAEV